MMAKPEEGLLGGRRLITRCELLTAKLSRLALSSFSSCIGGRRRIDEDKRRFYKEYRLGVVIGQGGFGRVYAGFRKKDGLQVAIKELPISDVDHASQDGQLPLEVILMQKVADVPGTIKFVDCFNMGHNYYVVMERFNSKDLFDFISEQGPLPENLAKNIFSQVLSTVLQCHAVGVLHRDIKDENLLIDLTTYKVKLIDFGSGTYLHDETYTEFEGTRVYSPPEWIKYRRYKADGLTVWSLGILLYDMLCGDVPYNSDHEIRDSQLTWKKEVEVSEEAREIVSKCLDPDPGCRISLDQLCQNPWLLELNKQSRIILNSEMNTCVPCVAGTVPSACRYELQVCGRPGKPIKQNLTPGRAVAV
jgi:serine/threonine protein kinase